MRYRNGHHCHRRRRYHYPPHRRDRHYHCRRRHLHNRILNKKQEKMKRNETIMETNR